MSSSRAGTTCTGSTAASVTVVRPPTRPPSRLDHHTNGVRQSGTSSGIAHYLFHASVWYAGKCYLADLFVDAEVRRRGIATAVIEWVARDAKEHGFPGLYWNTLEDAPARALYDKVGKFHKGLIHYAYRRDANQTSTQR
ncbi:GNAT family N-acetyltransferase [Nonomuraea dietziae]|uniref:GNAT family N-acetyltransferase n=1 Tax=Nonomuraea dietziae TaxID=65515 RepID=UPI0034279543